MINIIRGDTTKPVSTKRLVDYFNKHSDLEGTLYIGYPIIGTVEGALNIDALLVTKEYGVVIFDIVEGTEIDDRQEIQDDSYSKLHSKFFQYKDLVLRRSLQVPIEVITYAPAVNVNSDSTDYDYPIAFNNHMLDSLLTNLSWSELEKDSTLYNKLMAAIQAITTIKARPKRLKVKLADSKGAKIQQLEKSIANLDSTQSQAVIETVDGVQRIRGLAGSGKTIILALKVAYLHSKHPEWKIAITFNTRALKNQFRDLITRFTYEHKHAEPDWEKIKIIHAWGSPRTEGIYYELCKEHNVEYLDFRQAKAAVRTYGKEFDFVCEKAESEINIYKKLYDVILVDEAQDFSKFFLRICFNISGKLIYAYDELQSLNKQSMLSPEELFGLDENGRPLVSLRNDENKPRQDIILKQCYRNSRPILVSAHALGFGIYRENGLAQIFENKNLWRDIGYDVIDGQLEDDKHVVLGRSTETSPEFLETHSSIDDIIQFKTFNSNIEQNDWIANEIRKNLEEDELEYKDIMVINCDPISTKTDVAPLRSMLFNMKINSHLAGVNTSPDDFYDDDSITFTSIYRAKGNEAAMVYVLNAQDTSGMIDVSRKRNILFTAMTRSKAWIRVCGVGKGMQSLEDEFNEVKKNDFTLDFIYPNEEVRKTINIINRDLTSEEKKDLNKNKERVSEFLEALNSGKIYKEDLSPDQLKMLKDIFGND